MKVEDAGASPFEEQRERQPRPRRRRRWLVRGCLVPASLFVIAYLARALWAGPLIARYLEGEARERFDAELAIGRVSGGFFGDVVLDDVRWRSARGPLRAVEDARVSLGYGLFDRSGYPWLSVAIEGRGIELELGDGEGEARRALPDLPRFELDLAAVVVRRPGAENVTLDSIRGDLDIDEAIAEVDLTLVSGTNTFQIRSPGLELEGRSPLAWARRFRGHAAASITDAGPFLRLAGLDWPLASLHLEADGEPGRIELTGNAVFEGGQLALERGTLAWPPVNDAQEDVEPFLDLALQADFADLAPLAAVIGRPLAGRWKGALDVTGPLRGPTGRFVGRGEALEIEGVTVTTVDVDVETDGKTARFERCEISGPDVEAVLRGSVRLEPLELVDVAFNLSADRDTLSALLPFPCEHAFVHARLDGPPAEPRGAFEASATGIELGRLRIDDAEVRGTLEGTSIDVPELRLTSGASFVEASGSVARAGSDVTATLASLAVTWEERRVELEGGARLAFGPGRFATEGLELRSQSAGVEGRAAITLQHESGTTRGSLVFDRYDAGPLFATFLTSAWKAGMISGRIEGELVRDASERMPALDFDLALSGWDAGPAWPALDASLAGRIAEGALALTRLEVGSEAARAAHLSGSLRVPFDPAHPRAFAPGPLEIALTLESDHLIQTLRDLGREPPFAGSGAGRIAVELGGEWTALTGAIALEAADLVPAREDAAQAFDVALELALADDVRVTRGLLSSATGTVTLAGSVALAPDLPRWLEEPWELMDAPLDLATEIELVDIGWTASLARGLRRVSGRIAGRVTVGGSIREPTLGGGLTWRDGELRLLALATPVRALSADLRFEEDVVHLERLTGELGGAPVSASGTFEPFGPFPRIELELEGDNVLVRRSANLLVRADADLVVKGTLDQLSFRGELALAEGRYRGEISPLEELLHVGRRSEEEEARSDRFALWREGPLATAELDLHLGGTRTFEYRTNLLVASLRPDGWLRGTGAYPVLEGLVYVDDASLTLPPGTMVLDSGLLTFRREAPLVPDVAVKASMRIQNYDIRATATGTLDELEVILSSTPPLPNDDLWVLVLSGQLPTDRWEDRGSQAMEALAVFLARDTLVRWFSEEDDDGRNLLERFEIDVGAKPSRSGQTTGRVLFYLKPRTRGEKRATYISAELDEYDRINYALGIVFRRR